MMNLSEDPGWDREDTGIISLFESEITDGPVREGEFSTGTSTIPKGSGTANLRYEDKGWRKIRSTTRASNEIGYEADRERTLRMVRWLFYNNAWAHNIIHAYTFLTAGEGFDVDFEKDPDAKRWAEIAEENKWAQRHVRIIRDTYLLGEWFTVVIKEGNRVKIRGIEPMEITGIAHDPMDAEEIEGYDREAPSAIELPDSARRQRLDPATVIHTRVSDVGNAMRGTPILFPALRYLRYAEKFLQSRHFLNLLRARLPVIRKVIGSAADVQAQKAIVRTLPPPLTYIIENQNGEWQFPELHVDGSEAKPDFRNLLLAVSASVSLPEYLVTGDASNANYSSTLVAEAPMVRLFQALQVMFCADFRRLIRICVPGADVKVVAPPVIRRKIKDIAEAMSLCYDRGVVSKETFQEKLGLDNRIERERLARESAETDHEIQTQARRFRDEVNAQRDAQSPDRAEAS